MLIKSACWVRVRGTLHETLFNSSVISIQFHSLLSIQQIVQEELLKLLSLHDYIFNCRDCSVRHRADSQMRRFITIKCFKQSALNTTVKVCVLPPFRKRQPLTPLSWSVRDHASEVVFDALINSLSMFIALRVIGSVVVQLSSQ